MLTRETILVHLIVVGLSAIYKNTSTQELTFVCDLMSRSVRMVSQISKIIMVFT